MTRTFTNGPKQDIFKAVGRRCRAPCRKVWGFLLSRNRTRADHVHEVVSMSALHYIQFK